MTNLRIVFSSKKLLNCKQYLVIVIVFLTVNVYAQKIVTDRPDQTESSSTVGKGNLQIETGLLIGFEGDEQLSTRQILAPTTLFRYGINPNIELRLLNQFEAIKTQNISIQGISDIEIGTKIQILKKEGINSEIALLSHLLLPTGTKELSNANFSIINKLSISHELNEKIGLGYNVGYNYFGSGNGDLTYSLALGIEINEKVGIYIEPFGDYIEFEQFILNFDTGFTYLLKDNFQADFSFGTSASHTMNYISIGFSWLIYNK